MLRSPKKKRGDLPTGEPYFFFGGRFLPVLEIGEILDQQPALRTSRRPAVKQLIGPVDTGLVCLGLASGPTTAAGAAELASARTLASPSVPKPAPIRLSISLRVQSSGRCCVSIGLPCCIMEMAKCY